ncbi:nitroreductase family protein [Nonomuraea thailandensis]
MIDRSEKHALDAALEAARWAPSVHNTQPWTFSVTGRRSACAPTPAGGCGSATRPAASC